MRRRDVVVVFNVNLDLFWQLALLRHSAVQKGHLGAPSSQTTFETHVHKSRSLSSFSLVDI